MTVGIGVWVVIAAFFVVGIGLLVRHRRHPGQPGEQPSGAYACLAIAVVGLVVIGSFYMFNGSVTTVHRHVSPPSTSGSK